MRFLVLVFAIFNLAACNSGGGSGGNSDCNNPTCMGGYGRGKTVDARLSEQQKRDFFVFTGSLGRAQNAYMRIAFPKDKSNDPKEMEMYEILKAAGCQSLTTTVKTGDTYVVDQSIANAGCPINYFEHKEASETKQLIAQRYLVMTEPYKAKNDVVGTTLNAEHRISGRNASFEGTGKINSTAYNERSYYTFGTFQWSENGKSGKIRMGIGIEMPFGLVQATGTITANDGKATTEIEINGEKVDTSSSPEIANIEIIFKNLKY